MILFINLGIPVIIKISKQHQAVLYYLLFTIKK